MAFVEGSDAHALVAAVEADVVAVEEKALNAIGGDARSAERAAIRGAMTMVGTTGMPGHRESVARVTAFKTSGRMADAGALEISWTSLRVT